VEAAVVNQIRVKTRDPALSACLVQFIEVLLIACYLNYSLGAPPYRLGFTYLKRCRDECLAIDSW